jgi:penicillin V acylase-like amidase (Ntn superfamily)
VCTSLIYTASDNAPYLGRTLEFETDVPWAIAYVPAGTSFVPATDGTDPVTYSAAHRFLAVIPGNPAGAVGPSSMLATEGLNDAGLTVSMLMFPLAGGGAEVRNARAELLATNLGTWILSRFATVAEVKQGLQNQPVALVRLPSFDNQEAPFHFAVHDRFGGAIVIEWYRGQLTVYDNPVGVMTNGPEFSWHLTNLGNWTHLTNVDTSSTTFGSLTVNQPDPGIATAALPASNTSVGRFIRAIFYAQFAEKVQDPDRAMTTLARVMNNFDRPRDISVTPAGGVTEGALAPGAASSTEFTAWTNLTDLRRGHLLLRSFTAFNYTSFELDGLADVDGVRLLSFADLDAMGGDGTEALRSAGSDGVS